MSRKRRKPKKPKPTKKVVVSKKLSPEHQKALRTLLTMLR